MGMNLQLSASPNGTRNITLNATVVATENHVFGMDPSDPTLYHVPGNGSPAVSTTAYYNTFGLYNWQCCDLDAMGAEGAAIKAANGGRRYAWVGGADHPTNAYSWRGGDGTFVGYSFQPWDFPKKLTQIMTFYQTFSSTPNHSGGPFRAYEFPTIFYNPDDADGLPIYLMLETANPHLTTLWRSSDFVTFTLKEFSHWNSGGNRWSSFVRYCKRNGAGDFTSICSSTPGDANSGFCFSKWSSTDGIEYTSSYTAINGMQGGSNVQNSSVQPGHVFFVGSQMYCVGKESDVSTSKDYVTILPMDSSSFDIQASPAKVRIASGPVGGWSLANYPGPEYLQEGSGFYEDGLLFAWAYYGFPGDTNTIALGQQRGGAIYADDGGLDHQFIDKILVRVNDAAARLAAPAGMAVSCVSGVATISWIDALPQNTYRLYRGTDAATQATLIGDYSGVTSATDSPPIGRYWYKLVTLDGGTERKSRVLSVYVSSSTAFVNEHIDRVLDDGADSATINRDFLDRFDAMLDSIGKRNVFELCAHPAAGTDANGAPGGFLKVYDIGTTRLPRSEDFKATTSATTYDATGVNGGPCWTNANNNSYGYWGHLKRGNTIQQKRQITIIVAYERTQTTEDFTFIGTGPIWGNTADGNKILSLKHTAGTPGDISFSLSDATSTKTATVTASGSGMQIAIGTYDGTDMLAYTGSTAGSAVSTLDPNPNFGAYAVGPTDNYINSALAGSRNYGNSGSDFGASPFPQFIPFLGSGSVHCYNLVRAGVADVVTFTETNAKGKIQCVMVFEEALDAGEIADVITFLSSTADW
jgi:hypothetical protein